MPQGPLPLHFSGICPDAGAKVQPPAHQFTFAPDAQSGLITKSRLSGVPG